MNYLLLITNAVIPNTSDVRVKCPKFGTFYMKLPTIITYY